MYRYNGVLRLNGSNDNQVLKTNMSAAEVMILRYLHGSDAVIDVKEKPNDKTSHREERNRLRTLYARSLAKLHTPLTMEQLFGPEHMELPTRLPEISVIEEDEDGEKVTVTKKLKEHKKEYPAKVMPEVDTEDEIDLSQLAG